MRKSITISALALTGITLLASCNSSSNIPNSNVPKSNTDLVNSDKSTAINPLNTVGGAILKDVFANNKELHEAGWEYVAPGVAIRENKDNTQETFINYDLVDKTSLALLDAKAKENGQEASSVYSKAAKEIRDMTGKFSNNDITLFHEKYAVKPPLLAQDSASIGWFYQNLYGCSGELSAIPFDPGEGSKAFVKYECKGNNFQAVAEAYAAAGYGEGSVNYKAAQGRLNYIIADRPGKNFCESKGLLAIIVPGSTTITGGVSIGGKILKTVNGQASITSSVTYNQPAKITYSVSSKGC